MIRLNSDNIFREKPPQNKMFPFQYLTKKMNPNTSKDTEMKDSGLSGFFSGLVSYMLYDMLYNFLFHFQPQYFGILGYAPATITPIITEKTE